MVNVGKYTSPTECLWFTLPPIIMEVENNPFGDNFHIFRSDPIFHETMRTWEEEYMFGEFFTQAQEFFPPKTLLGRSADSHPCIPGFQLVFSVVGFDGLTWDLVIGFLRGGVQGEGVTGEP